MQTGTIIMLIVIIVGIYGSAGMLLSKNMKDEAKKNAENDK